MLLFMSITTSNIKFYFLKRIFNWQFNYHRLQFKLTWRRRSSSWSMTSGRIMGTKDLYQAGLPTRNCWWRNAAVVCFLAAFCYIHVDRLSICLQDLYTALQKFNFKREHIEEAMKSSVLYGGDLHSALDWLCLNLSDGDQVIWYQIILNDTKILSRLCFIFYYLCVCLCPRGAAWRLHSADARGEPEEQAQVPGSNSAETCRAEPQSTQQWRQRDQQGLWVYLHLSLKARSV